MKTWTSNNYNIKTLGTIYVYSNFINECVKFFRKMIFLHFFWLNFDTTNVSPHFQFSFFLFKCHTSVIGAKIFRFHGGTPTLVLFGRENWFKWKEKIGHLVCILHDNWWFCGCACVFGPLFRFVVCLHWDILGHSLVCCWFFRGWVVRGLYRSIRGQLLRGWLCVWFLFRLLWLIMGVLQMWCACVCFGKYDSVSA